MTKFTHQNDLGDSTNWDIDLASIGVTNYLVTTIVYGGACDVKMIYDADGDFTSPDVTITLDSFTGSGISQSNEIPINEHQNYRLRITNTSGGSADYVVVAEEV